MTAVKASISLERQHMRWLKKQARKRKTSVSALVAEAIVDLRRRAAREELIEQLGGWLELSDKDVAEIEAEWASD